MAVDLVGIQTVDHLNRIFQLNNHNFKQALTRSGHARFRRGPLSSDPHAPSVSSQSEDKLLRDSTNKSVAIVVTDATASFHSMTSSLGVVAPAPSFSSRKPPLPSSHRKRHATDTTTSDSLLGSRTACHCWNNRRKTGSKREVRRIPIIGSKVESIPADDYTWKKYGEKKVNGSLFPRVYYKCNSVKGCPARKRVELSVTDSKMLVVTYDGDHRHRQNLSDENVKCHRKDGVRIFYKM